MAPVFSRLNPAPLPDDVLRTIASFLPSGDLRNLTISSKALHSAGAPILYRSIEAWFVPTPFFANATCIDNRPAGVLETLINGTLPRTTRSIPSRCYAAHVVTLCYGSWSMPCDFRALPLLAEALRFTHKLRHLRIDVGNSTIPILLDIFRRASIIITPSSLLKTSGPFDRRPLPCLQSIRVCRIALADALMQHRRIETVAIELAVKEEVLAKFLRAEAPWNPRYLRQLSLNIMGCSAPPGLLESFLIAFPALQHLALRVASGRAPEFMQDSLATLQNLPELGGSLHTLSINHGNFYPNLAPSLEQLHTLFKDGLCTRSALKAVVLGGSMWTREDMYAAWSFVAFQNSYLTHWPWLLHSSEGEWGTLGDAVKAYYHEE
ncbi:hypothetical protein GSI_11965 [Ganoderma sinense ZZ0214-1]|uniref:F-box domain-containing protein n=1 Tax=Ganoderma sinense ZZ0214-1 TaxID=1077348 RepID=A0A2G8RXH1_9APHY|nr:hypothetical protein GSI_11965 [Ganoderma sinense ZZ0214-1]